MVKFIVLTANTWGAGENETEATTFARARGKERLIYIMKDTVKFVGVDDLGRIHWEGDDDGVAEVWHMKNGKKRKLARADW